MLSHKRLATVFFIGTFAVLSPIFAQKGYVNSGAKAENTQAPITELWTQPNDIHSENLFYGAGGKEHEPAGPFTFLKEDMGGTNPKYDVRDAKGVRWKIKLGEEAQPETVATRFVWAVGYHADQDYLLPQIKVDNLPEHVHRGQDLIQAGGVMHNARLKREEGEKTVGNWPWKDNPFSGTRELDGLRVMMAVINNWDLKDENNSIRDEAQEGGGTLRFYEVSDLGASFGTTGRGMTHAGSKGNLNAYTHSSLIEREHADTVDFNVPSRPAMPLVFDTPEFFGRVSMRWIGRGIPRQNARWIGDLLGQLSNDQIRDAFGAGGYSGAELDGFVNDFELRIAELKKLGAASESLPALRAFPQ